jgi:hypothetical protein
MGKVRNFHSDSKRELIMECFLRFLFDMKFIESDTEKLSADISK